MFTKFIETARVFAKSRPSIRDLWASRHGSLASLHGILPSDAVVGEPVHLTIQAWDEYERLLQDDRMVEISSTDTEATHPTGIRLDDEADGLGRTTVRFASPGIQWVSLSVQGGDGEFVTNPVRVHATAPDIRTFWGDIHLHSQYSDGAGSLRRGLEFARDVMDLDVVAYTDHDTMGFFIPPQWQLRRMRRQYFEEIKDQVRAVHDPGELVTLFGYEWTKQPNMGGHLNCYFDSIEAAELFASLESESRTYEALWQRLREWRETTGADVVTIPHHPAEAMYPFDFSQVDYDDELAPLVEVYSQWGSSERPEADGNQKPLKMGQGEVEEPGHYVQDALALGHRVGMMASADYHGPHPGHSLIHAKPHLPSLGEWRRDGLGWGLIWRVWSERSYPGGLTAFRTSELTREAIFDALRTRRVYGTSQPHRILVEFEINGRSLDESDHTVPVPVETTPRDIRFDVAGTAPITTVEVVKNNAVFETVSGTERGGVRATHRLRERMTDTDPITGVSWDSSRGTEDDVYYLRVSQADGGMAWVGPLWVTVSG